MRTLALIPHPACRITILSWNGKFILKFEAASLEQIYKIDEFEAGDLEILKSKLSPSFLQKVIERFTEMQNELDSLAE